MVLKLHSGGTRLRTIFNVIKVKQDVLGQIIVINRVEGVVITNTFQFDINYNRFEITID